MLRPIQCAFWRGQAGTGIGEGSSTASKGRATVHADSFRSPVPVAPLQGDSKTGATLKSG